MWGVYCVLKTQWYYKVIWRFNSNKNWETSGRWKEVQMAIQVWRVDDAIYHLVKGHLKLNQYGYAKTLSSDFGAKIWAMAFDWENLLTPGRNGKQLITGLTIHRLTGRKDVIQMLHKLNVCSWYNNIRLQNKSWATMVVSRKRISKSMLKKLPLHAMIDNNDDMQGTLTEKNTTHDANMTLFQSLCKGLRFLVNVSFRNFLLISINCIWMNDKTVFFIVIFQVFHYFIIMGRKSLIEKSFSGSRFGH